jgi:tRNA pseudouridine55 synthase
VDGVLIVNKPGGMTSHDVVARVRRATGEKSVGHLGTLDPMATGVLPLVLGRFTRLAQFYNESDKRYEGVIQFGWATNTYDAEGEASGAPQTVSLCLEEIRAAAKNFTGHIDQYPPPFSAKKIAGIPAHRLARKGLPVNLQPKRVEIKELEITSFDGQRAHFNAWVSSGTYLRSLAHDMGSKLGPGAHLAELQRTAVREFTLEEACTLEDIEKAVRLPEGITELCLHPRLVLPEFPAVVASPEIAARIRHGAAVNLPEFSKAAVVRVFAGQRELLAIARRVAGTLFQPKVVL